MNTTEFFRRIKGSPVELFGVIFFRDNDIAGTQILGEGHARGVTFSIAAVVDAAKALGAQGMTLVHNHPSGDLRPSKLDLQATYTLADYCKPLNLVVNDHIILGKGGYYSFKASGAI